MIPKKLPIKKRTQFTLNRIIVEESLKYTYENSNSPVTTYNYLELDEQDETRKQIEKAIQTAKRPTKGFYIHK
jgi:hypothetical protein